MLICIPWVAIGPDVIYTVALKVLKPNPIDKVVSIYKNESSSRKKGLPGAINNGGMNNLNGKVVNVRP